MSSQTAEAAQSWVSTDHDRSSAPTLTMITLAWVAASARGSWGGAISPLYSTSGPIRPFWIVALPQARLSTFHWLAATRSAA